MKALPIFVFPLTLFLVGSMACTADSPVDGPGAKNNSSQENAPKDSVANRLLIRIGSSTFTATLATNATVTALKKQLPMTLSMKELNDNEKFAQLSSELPTQSSNPGTIQSGDLMLYGSNTLVLFYKSFSTSYSYTRLGHIDNPTGLATALGPGNITVTFELNK